MRLSPRSDTLCPHSRWDGWKNYFLTKDNMKKLFLVLWLLLLPLQALFASDNETEKLQWHLNRVEWILRKVDTSSLTEEQRNNRSSMLDLLHSYTKIGKFPNNDRFPWQSIPFFRGSNGNLCAVGYLMDHDPDYQSFIEQVVNTNNHLQLMDIQSNPVINSWEKKYGFNTLELAMIQPTYGFETCWFRYIVYCDNFIGLFPDIKDFFSRFSLNPYILLNDTLNPGDYRNPYYYIKDYNRISWIYFIIFVADFLAIITSLILLLYLYPRRQSISSEWKWKYYGVLFKVLIAFILLFQLIIYCLKVLY